MGKRTQRLAECCFTSTETVGLLGTGAHDDLPDFHTSPATLGAAGPARKC